MTGIGDLLKSWQEQQEAIWTALKGASMKSGDPASGWWANLKPGFMPPSFGGLGAGHWFGLPGQTPFQERFDIPELLAGEAKRLADRELGEEQLKQLADSWTALLNIPGAKMAAEYALSGAAAADAMQEAVKLNPLVSAPAAIFDDIQATWKATLEAYIRLLGLFDGFAKEVSTRFLKLLDGREDKIRSVNDLFDTWMTAAEDEYNAVTMTPGYRHAFGDFVNSLGRAAQQRRDLTDRTLEMFGMPTYSELSNVHARIQGLRKENRQIREEVGALRSELQGLQAELSRAAGIAERASALENTIQEMRERLAQIQGDVRRRAGRPPSKSAGSRAPSGKKSKARE